MYEQDGVEQKTVQLFWYHWAKWVLWKWPPFSLTFLVRGRFSMWSPTPRRPSDRSRKSMTKQVLDYRRELWHWSCSSSPLLWRKRATRSMGWIRERILSCRVIFTLTVGLNSWLTPIFDWCPEVEILCNTAGVWMTCRFWSSAEEIQEILINYRTPVELDTALSDSNVGEEARDRHQHVLHCF